MIQLRVAPDLTSRTDWTNPVMEVSPTFRALFAPLNCAIRHRLASFTSVVSNVCIASPKMICLGKLLCQGYGPVKDETQHYRSY